MTKKYEKYISKKKKKGKSKTQKRKTQKRKQKHNKYGGNGRLNFYDYLVSQFMYDLVHWFNKLEPEQKDILNNTFLENNNNIHLENGCFKLGKGSFGVVYLNSPQRFENMEQEPLENKIKKNHFIKDNVIKVIENKKIIYLKLKNDFNTFFIENIQELFFVKKVVNNYLKNPENPEPLHVVDIQHFLFENGDEIKLENGDDSNSTLFFVMERFEYTLHDLILSKNTSQQGGVLTNNSNILKSFHVEDFYDFGQFGTQTRNKTGECSLDKKAQKNNDLLFEIYQTKKKEIMIQIIQGLIQIHDAGVVHCDLKPENIFLTEDDFGFLQVCIADFGLAKNQNDERYVEGTIQYMPPECLKSFYEKKIHKFSFDIYSLGIVCNELFGNLNLSIKNFIIVCTDNNPENRPTAQECLEMVSTWGG